MKKLVFLTISVLILSIPFLESFAQIEEPAACCRLIRNFTTVDPACTAGAVVGNPAEGPCPYPGVVTVANWGLCCTLNSVARVTNYIFYFFMLLAVIFGIYAAFMFITAGGDEEKIKKARSIIFYVVIAIIIAVLARFLPTAVQAVLR